MAGRGLPWKTRSPVIAGLTRITPRVPLPLLPLGPGGVRGSRLCGTRLSPGRASSRFQPDDILFILPSKRMAEREGFEPSRPVFTNLRDFQSRSFGQLGHLSALIRGGSKRAALNRPLKNIKTRGPVQFKAGRVMKSRSFAGAGIWRRGRDSNPRYRKRYNRFRVCRLKPDSATSPNKRRSRERLAHD